MKVVELYIGSRGNGVAVFMQERECTILKQALLQTSAIAGQLVQHRHDMSLARVCHARWSMESRIYC